MKKIRLLGPLFSAALAYGQSNTENYVQSNTCLNGDCTKKIQAITYFDGLGRPKQIVGVKATPTGKDLVTPIIYDGLGRQTKDILPVPAGSLGGAIHTGITNEGAANTFYGASNAFLEREMEKSPLARVLQQAQPGESWKMSSGHTLQYKYEVNTASEVRKFVTTTSTITVGTGSRTESSVPVSSGTGFHPVGSLYKNTVTDEDGNPVVQYMNGLGQVLLVRRMDGTQNVDTYYIYNEYGQLAFVLPPKATKEIEVNNNAITLDILNNLCYQYRYDGRGRLVEKRLPGKEDWESMVYDAANRLVLTQDANQKKQGQWLFMKYDRLGRTAYSGLMTGGDRASLQDQIGNQIIIEQMSNGFMKNGRMVYYTNNFLSNFTTVLTVDYYDVYPRDSQELPPVKILDQYVMNPEKALNDGISTLSLPTATYVKNIEDDNWTRAYSYYDTKGRAVGTLSMNHLGGYTKTESQLDFAGLPQQTITRHKRNNTSIEVVIKERFEYDNANRLYKHWHQVDDKPEQLLAENTYNDLSQLENKKVGNNLQSIDYAYNIRGWLTDINKNQMPVANLDGKLFAYKVRYDGKSGITNPDPTLFSGKDVKPRYNGNITEVDWRAVETIGANPPAEPKRYGYAYDGLNRLTAGYYQNPNNPWSKEHTESMEYDLGGNITKLYRTSLKDPYNTTATVIDDLNYVYSGNKLTKVNDISTNPSGYEGGGNTITYDANGNMENLKDKGITSIKYNFLNLPNQMESLSTDVSIKYKYNALGVKLQKVRSNGECGITSCYTVNITSDYLDGFQYVGTSKTGGGGTEESLQMGRELSKAMETQAYTLDGIGVIDPGIDPPGGGITTTLKDENLSFFPTAEGYYDYKKDQYIYQYKDLLENVRISFGRNSTGALEIVDANDYYPFGMNHLKTGNAFYGQGTYKNYKFLGKELQETGFYDMGARFYMPELGIFGQHDPLSSGTQDPYGYAYNNPIFYVDPTGLYGDPVNGGDKNIPPSSPGGANNPYQLDEVVIDPPAKALVTKTKSVMPNNCLVCNINGRVLAPGIISNAPQIRRSYYNFNPYIPNNNPEWYGFGGRANWGLATSAASLENFSGSTRVTTTGSSIRLYRRNINGNVFIKNQYVKTTALSKIGTGLGQFSFALGIIMDLRGMQIYKDDPTSPNAVHPAKAAINTGIGAIGTFGGWPGAIYSSFYFGVDGFYPDGWDGAGEDFMKAEEETNFHIDWGTMAPNGA